jgi:hypothetical protein
LGGLISTAQIASEAWLKIAIIGEPKTGKSWMATTAPGPILIYDFDGRAASLRGKPNVMVKTVQDKSQESPSAMAEVETDLNTFKYRKKNGKLIPTTFVFDSVSYMKKAMENELMKQMGKDYYRVIKLSPLSNLRVPQGWDVINGVKGYLEYLVAEFGALGNIICVFHVRDEKDRDKSTKTEAAYTGKLTVDPQYLAGVLSVFNEVYYISVDSGGRYTVTVKPNYECRASTTLLLDDKETPDIQAIIAKHQQRLATKK